jgi:flagellar secretion chaperone FliS
VNVQTRGASAYRQVQVQSRSPLELVVMLYDGALASLTEASGAAARNDIRTRVAAVSKALTIITELQNTLNLDEGGKVAADLDRLYSYASQRLLDVTTRGDLDALQEVHKLLTVVREAWHEISLQQS